MIGLSGRPKWTPLDNGRDCTIGINQRMSVSWNVMGGERSLGVTYPQIRLKDQLELAERTQKELPRIGTRTYQTRLSMGTRYR